MNSAYNDKKYICIVGNILNNKKFRKIEEFDHHGISRLNHSVRVSYYSYKLSRLLGLDYRKTARAGLLHDFFLLNNETGKEKLKSVFTHSKEAVKNADSCFILSDLECDIIKTHMFPLASPQPPKYAEGWIVSLVDKAISLGEFTASYSNNFSLKFKNATIITALFLCQVIFK
ncbi:MAG: HD domain-containing protein [bacterium]|nr:HD domain-containing protein [bacterium]